MSGKKDQAGSDSRTAAPEAGASSWDNRALVCFIARVTALSYI